MELKPFNVILKVIVLFMLLNIVGCGAGTPEKISVNELQKKWDDVINNSSESWWYAGSENAQHIIIIKRPLITSPFAVDKSGMDILNIDVFEYTDDDSKWVNLKTDNIKFK